MPNNVTARKLAALNSAWRSGSGSDARRPSTRIEWSSEKVRQTEPKRVGLFGSFGIGNFGNDGSLQSMLLLLQRVAPQEHLLCICGNPAVVKEAFGLDAVPIYYRARHSSGRRAAVLLEKALGRATLWLHAMRHLRRLKVLIVPGTGVLDDFSVSPIGWPYDLLSWFLLARLMGVKVVLASVGAGPIRHPVSRWLMKSAARAAHYRSYRDIISKEFMESIGLRTQDDSVYPDIAFNLPQPFAPRRSAAPGREPLTIGVGVMTYHGWRNDPSRGAEIYAAYLEKITQFVLWLVERGYAARILMGEDSDRRAVDDLFEALRKGALDRDVDSVVFAPAHTLHEVMEQIARVDVVVATRYHNVVCALRMRKPTISIGYAAKNDALLTEMGLADFCQHIEHLDLQRLKDQVTRLVADRAHFERRISEASTHFEQRLREQEARLGLLIRSTFS